MKLLKRITIWLTLIIGKFKAWINENVEPALEIVNTIKEVVDNPALDILTKLSENKWDEALLARAREALFQAVNILEISKACGKKETEFDKLACLIGSLRQHSPAMRSAIYQKLASILAIELSEDKIQEYEADTLVQLTYANRKLKA